MNKTFTIAKFKQLTDIGLNKDLLPIEKEIEIAKLVYDKTDEEIDAMSIEEFSAFTFDIKTEGVAIQPEFEFNDVVYKLVGDPDNFKFSVKQMIAVQKAMQKDSTNYIHKMMAVIYVADDQVSGENVFFEHMPFEYAVPFLNVIAKKYGKANFTVK